MLREQIKCNYIKCSFKTRGGIKEKKQEKMQ